VRILEQRREARIQTEALGIGRTAIESLLARDPSEIVADPPPFPIPTLDGVLTAWRNTASQEERFRGVLEDRRANAPRISRKSGGAFATSYEQRRTKDDLEKIRLETELRSLNDRLVVG
jgi:hypothetical protein